MITDTVKIVCDEHPEGWITINKSEFNADVHQLYVKDGEDTLKKPGRPKKAAE